MKGITITVEGEGQGTEPVLHPVSQRKSVVFLLNYPNGIQKMCGFIDGLVETSCNVNYKTHSCCTQVVLPV